MRKSEIFEEFAKLAVDSGLITEASSEDLQRKLEENPRMDSLDISAIEALYGVKPDTPKDMQYKKNIIEDAHPTSVVVSPAHDKINGLVENNNERQTIILNILNHITNGHLTNRKYAEKNLLLSLVKIGNYLDNAGNNKLQVLADACLEQVSKDIKKKRSFKKEAIGTVGVIGIIAGVAALVGAIWLQQHSDFIDDGFVKNHEKLVNEIDDILKSSSSIQTMLGAGQTYSPTLLKELSDLKIKMTELYETYQEIIPIFNDIQSAKSEEELIELAKNPKTQQHMKARQKLYSKFKVILPDLLNIQTNFPSESYQKMHVQEKGTMQKLLERTKIFYGGNGLITNDFNDVVKGIPPYIDSVNQMLKILSGAAARTSSAYQKLTATLNATLEGKSEVPQEETNKPATSTSTSTSTSVDEEAEKINQSLKRF